MPVNKNAYFRYKVIDNCLRQTYRKFNPKSLLEEVSETIRNELGIEKGISLRTLFLDLKQMQAPPPAGFNAPIDLDIENNYFYTDPDFSITNCPLVDADADKLQEALVILKQFSAFPQLEGIESIIKKLELKSGLKGKPLKQVVEFERTENVYGIKYLEIIYNAIVKTRTLKIDYKPFHHDKAGTIILHPYLLKEYNNRWFVFGLNHEFKKITVLALDRIEKINHADKVFIENTFFSSSVYFSNIIGVSLPLDSKIQCIQAQIKKPRSHYVLTKPFHQSQKALKETEKYILFEWQLISNPELIGLFLSFGSDITVIKPLNLKAEIKERLVETIQNYKK